MQNAEYRMQNCGVRYADLLKIMSEGHTLILHFEFCILHSKQKSTAFRQFP